MELRIASARATKDIDLTCLRRADDQDISIESVITEELRELAKKDLNDYFTFEIGQAKKDLDNAPYGGARYSVASFLDKRLFVRFQLDVGADSVVDEVEFMEGSDWLGHYGIENPKMRMISIEQQFAEKLHAYSLPREQRVNTRAKDLVDMLLLLELREIDGESLIDVVQKIFRVRRTHPLPKNLEPPPPEWALVYEALANECGITLSMFQAYEELNKFFGAAAEAAGFN
ncbi:hypothetical protein NEPTK9_001140 [Candidatus Neptunochlamydia vexilliferae]|uniref:Uncharacterized protein n=2 Tax=Candidatus Neptunichlamydia vexilliferae TaxID=1651774 RepID=A0ABS0AZR3_9BACT|nr:hypothetical protein [Candidatus Neptunochlamydia vexilliferae]